MSTLLVNNKSLYLFPSVFLLCLDSLKIYKKIRKFKTICKSKVNSLSSEVSSVSQSVWTYIIWWNSFSEESEVISNINTIKETFNRGYLNLVIVNLSETDFLWLCEFNDVVTDLHFYNTYVSDTAVSA